MDDQTQDRRESAAHAGDSHSERGLRARPTIVNASEDVAIITNIPRTLPVLRGEVALLRAFLGEQIDSVLFPER